MLLITCATEHVYTDCSVTKPASGPCILTILNTDLYPHYTNFRSKKASNLQKDSQMAISTNTVMHAHGPVIKQCWVCMAIEGQPQSSRLILTHHPP